MTMQFLNGHLNVTGKSLGGVATALLAAVVAFGYLTPEKAAVVMGLVGAVLAVLVPDRDQGATNPVPTDPQSDEKDGTLHTLGGDYKQP